MLMRAQATAYGYFKVALIKKSKAKLSNCDRRGNKKQRLL